MPRRLSLFIFLLFCLLVTACTGNQGGGNVTNTPVVLTVPPIDQATAVPPTATNTTIVAGPTAVTPTPIPVPTNTLAPPPPDLSLMPGGVTLYPVPKIYDGDLVSFKIAPNIPPGVGFNDVRVQILVDNQQVVKEILNWRSLGGGTYGLYEWVWNTSGQIGQRTVTIIIDPDDRIQTGDENPNNNQVVLNVNVNPRTSLPPSAANASWITASNSCCNLHVISGTAAHRDLTDLLEMTDAAFAASASQLGEALDQQFDVYFIDRVLGQGGYASGAMVISYLDRDYTGGGTYEVLLHESVHLIDHSFAPNRITFLAEGVAVWATGGHYQQEELGRRVAALIENGEYIPLAELIDNFYPAQHEISYLEAGSLIDYLVEVYGWEQVRNFYSDTTVFDGVSLSNSVDINLQLYFNKSLAEIETDWLGYVLDLPRDARETADLQTTIRYYDVMRLYQEEFDPTAYYLSAWLPSPAELERQGITADFLRHPETATNIALESLLISAHNALEAGEYERANALLDSVIRVLDNDGTFLDPLAGNYLDIVRTTTAMNYQVQEIEIDGTVARVVVSRPGSVELVNLNLTLQNNSWILVR